MGLQFFQVFIYSSFFVIVLNWLEDKHLLVDLKWFMASDKEQKIRLFWPQTNKLTPRKHLLQSAFCVMEVS